MKRGGGPVPVGWGRSVLQAALVLGAVYVGLALVPDWLMESLTDRVSSRVRDALVGVWWAVVFVALSWGFVLVQRRRRA